MTINLFTILLAFVCTSNSFSQKNDFESFKKKITLSDSSKTQVPFGCELLTTHNFPKSWKVDSYDDIDSILPHEKELEELYKCYGIINSSKTIKLPLISSMEFIGIKNKINDIIRSDTLISMHAADSIRYRLIDFGPYECYYSYEESKVNYGGYGNLVLYNPKFKKAKIINIYFEGSGDQYAEFRFFYIDRYKRIHLFEGVCYEDACSLSKKHSIIIKSNGNIKIRK